MGGVDGSRLETVQAGGLRIAPPVEKLDTLIVNQYPSEKEFRQKWQQARGVLKDELHLSDAMVGKLGRRIYACSILEGEIRGSVPVTSGKYSFDETGLDAADGRFEGYRVETASRLLNDIIDPHRRGSVGGHLNISPSGETYLASIDDNIWHSVQSALRGFIRPEIVAVISETIGEEELTRRLNTLVGPAHKVSEKRGTPNLLKAFRKRLPA